MLKEQRSECMAVFIEAPESNEELKEISRRVPGPLVANMTMYLCRKHTAISLRAIGDEFVGRDDSTVIHASKTIERKLRTILYMQLTIASIERNLNIRK